MKQPEVTLVAIEMADGSVSIMLFVTNDYRGLVQKATNENIEAEIVKTFALHEVKPVRWKLTKHDEIPGDRYFRDAWVFKEGKKIDVHMERAKEIHKNVLRGHRENHFIKLDKEHLIAVEKGDAEGLKKVAVKKQKLRDITDHPLIQAASTPEELKQLSLQVLLDSK
jgi:hypothetical protein